MVMSFEDDLREQTSEEKPTASVDLKIGSGLYSLKLTRMDPVEWVLEIDKHPARPDSAYDRKYGYNLRTLTYAVAVDGELSRDGEIVKPTEPQWRSLLSSLDGGSMGRLGDAIFYLNEYGPAAEINALKKAQEGGSENTSTSPSEPALAPDESLDGSPFTD